MKQDEPREVSPFAFLKDEEDGKHFVPVVMAADMEVEDEEELDPTRAPLDAVELTEGELAGAGGATSFVSSAPPLSEKEKSGAGTQPVQVTRLSDTDGADLPKPSSPPVVPTPPIVPTPSSLTAAKITPPAS